MIISGLSENLCRIAPLFDSQGNQIEQKSKEKAVYESQENSESPESTESPESQEGPEKRQQSPSSAAG